MFRPLSLPVRLAFLVAGTLLPLIGFAAAISYQHYKNNQAEAFDRVVQFTRGIQFAFDREMQGIVAGMRVLANTNALARDDFEGFRRNADGFLAQYPGQSSIVLGDRHGRVLFNSSEPRGATLRQRTEREGRDTVFKTGTPVYSPLFFGTLSNRPVVTITVPVFRDGQVIYDLSFDPPQEIFQHILEQQSPGGDWTMSFFDQKGVNFARVPNPEQTVGKSASPTLLAIMFSAPEGRARTVSLEGVPLLTAFVRSNLTGWVAASGIAEETLTAPALRSFILTGTMGLAMLIIGLAFAVRMATTIARAEALHVLLINELNHRVKNTLATVQSLSAQTFRSSTDNEARSKFDARLGSLGRTHDVLSAKKWESALLSEVIDAALAPFDSANPDVIKKGGPPVAMSSRSVVMVSMVIHELATNASKYGALSRPGGRVSIYWATLADGKVALDWRESGGPAVDQPSRQGFGSRLIGEGFAAQLGGTAKLSFEPRGVTCRLEFPAN